MNKKNILLFSIFLTGFLLRIAFIGYNTLGHGEAEMAQNISYVMPCLRGYSYLAGLWRLWHIFMMGHSPIYTTLFPINFTLAWFAGVNEFTLRIHAAIAGMVSALAVYLLLRRHADAKTALLGLTLFIFNPYLIIYHRFAHPDSIQTAVGVMGVWFLDTYCRKRSLPFLILTAVFLSWSFLLKMQSAVFICIILFLYFLYFGLKIREILLIACSSVIFILLLFADQAGVFLNSIIVAKNLSGGLTRLPEVLPGMVYFFGSAHIKYFELTILPLGICIFFWRSIENRFFRLLVVFSIIYFIAIILQGRPFFRYLQVGIITVAAAFAFILSRFCSRRYYYGGCIFMVVLLSFSLFAHRSYISALRHHIPYKYIAKRAEQLRGRGRILIYGRNSETEYYLSPTGSYIFDESINPCRGGIIELVDEYKVMFDSVRKIPPVESGLFNVRLVRPGDILVVTGMQMVGGEPAPRLHGYDGRGFRVYRHGLKMPQGFYKRFMESKKMQRHFVLLDKIYLTNGSPQLAALILRKK